MSTDADWSLRDYVTPPVDFAAVGDKSYFPKFYKKIMLVCISGVAIPGDDKRRLLVIVGDVSLCHN